MSFHVGDLWEPEVTCTPRGSSTPAEPGSWTFTFESHKGHKTTSSVTKVSPGVAVSKQELTEPGDWVVNVKTTAPYQGSQSFGITVEGEFQVNP